MILLKIKFGSGLVLLIKAPNVSNKAIRRAKPKVYFIALCNLSCEFDSDSSLKKCKNGITTKMRNVMIPYNAKMWGSIDC